MKNTSLLRIWSDAGGPGRTGVRGKNREKEENSPSLTIPLLFLSWFEYKSNLNFE
jgi:hypothetical protein